MLEFRETLLRYEAAEAELISEPTSIRDNYDNASVARQAAIIQEQEIEQIRKSSPDTPPIDDSTP